MHETLKKLTSHVRETKGSGEALRFYVNFIQPIEEYFGGDAEVKKLHISDVMNSILNDLQERQNDFENPGSYMEDEWYIKCQAKAEAFEEAISIVKKYYS